MDGKQMLEDFMSKQTTWEFKIVDYLGESYEVPVTTNWLYIAYNDKWKTTILYASKEKPVWDNQRLTWRKNKGDMPLEVRPFEGVIPFMASKESLRSI